MMMFVASVDRTRGNSGPDLELDLGGQPFDLRLGMHLWLGRDLDTEQERMQKQSDTCSASHCIEHTLWG
jgi:hypothetical protein